MTERIGGGGSFGAGSGATGTDNEIGGGGGGDDGGSSSGGGGGGGSDDDDGGGRSSITRRVTVTDSIFGGGGVIGDNTTDPALSDSPGGGGGTSPTRTVAGSTTLPDIQTTIPDPRAGTPSAGGNPSTAPRTETRFDEIDTSTGGGSSSGGAPIGGSVDRVSIAGDGPIASIGIPGTDTDVGGALDSGTLAFETQVSRPAGRIGRTVAEEGTPFLPGGGEARGQLGEDFARSAAGVANLPGFAAAGVRVADETSRQLEPAGVGGPLVPTADPGRTDAQGAAIAEGSEAAAEFAAENPGRVGAGAAGAIAGGLGASALSRGALRGGRGALDRVGGSADDAVGVGPRDPNARIGSDAPGSVLDPSDVRQPASSPGRATQSRLDRIRRDLDDLLGDDRGQLGAGRQRRRPGDSDTDSGPPQDPLGSSDDLLEGSPRDRISTDITRRQRTDLEGSRGTFDAGDAIDPVGGRSSRTPLDPLDTRGGRRPTGDDAGSGFGLGLGDAGLGTGAAVGGLLGEAQDTAGDSSLGFDPGLELGGIEDAVGDRTGERGRGDTGTDTGTGSRADTRAAPAEDEAPLALIRASALTGAQQAPGPTRESPVQTPRTRTGSRIGRGGGRPTRRRGGGTVTSGPPRPRSGDLDLPDAPEPEEDLELDVLADDAVVEFETRSLSEIDDDLADSFGAIDDDLDSI